MVAPPIQSDGKVNSLQLAEQMGDVKTSPVQLGVGFLLGIPEIDVLLLRLKPAKRQDRIHVVRGVEGARAG
jgi:hypothetical protein